MLRSLFLAAAALTLAACASTGASEQTASAAAPAQDCFRNDDIFGYGVIDNHNIEVRARGRYYILTTNWNARDLDWTQAIAIRSPTNWICVGNGLGVEIIGGEPQNRYSVVSIQRKPEEPEATGS
ncbi:MAG TPA: DUF6491 family protein [Terricaulis sp.]|nr:DUF6491 family protein [Terricaulis sp.]